MSKIVIWEWWNVLGVIYEGFQYVEIKSNEIKSYLDSQYLIILCSTIYIGPSVSAHAVLVIGYDNNNNFIVVDPATGKIRKQKDDGDYTSIIAISPTNIFINK